jgi:polyhydroxybutyrate depolymerase
LITGLLSVFFGLILIVGMTLAVFIFLVDRSNGHILSSGEKRYYLLHVPQKYDQSSPTPLVIALHGSAEWPALNSWISQWYKVAEENGFLVVHPSGTRLPKRWRAHGSMKESSSPAIDVRFIAGLIDALQDQYSIDLHRIYICGFSNGGGMAYLLGCSLSNRIAAIGSVSGAYFHALEECSPSRPVPLIVFHGTHDRVVPYTGGPSGPYKIPFPDIRQWVESYARLNQCDSSPISLPSNAEDVSGIQYIGKNPNSDVVLYTIAGGGHSWPGGNPLPGWISGKTSQSISATNLMWEFFKAHPLAKNLP